LNTYAEILEHVGVTVPDPVFAQLEVPVISDLPQRQGDVFIEPTPRIPAGGNPIPHAGVAVVRGEATGNTHILQTFGTCTWLPSDGRGVVLGHLHVPAGETCNLIHTDEHGVNAVGPGSYTLKGKRELADEIRRVAD
jgi:hypothetical protein